MGRKNVFDFWCILGHPNHSCIRKGCSVSTAQLNLNSGKGTTSKAIYFQFGSIQYFCFTLVMLLMQRRVINVLIKYHFQLWLITSKQRRDFETENGMSNVAYTHNKHDDGVGNVCKSPLYQCYCTASSVWCLIATVCNFTTARQNLIELVYFSPSLSYTNFRYIALLSNSTC